MSLSTTVITPLRSLAHYLDQPQVINGVHRFIQKTGIHAGFAGKAMVDLAMAPADKRKDVLIEDALVLGPVWGATYYGLGALSEKADAMPPIPAHLKKLYPSLAQLFSRVEKNRPKVRGKFWYTEIKEIVSRVYQNKTRVRQGSAVVSQAGLHLEQIFPLPHGHDHGASMTGMIKNLFRGKFPSGKQLWALRKDDMVKFFTIGGLIVVAGLVGGLVSDYLRGIHTKQAKVDKIKEGIFQFIANIAMCAVGATIGMTVADSVLPEKMMKTARNPQFIRAGRFGIIMAGLSIGIVGGGYIANWVGRKFVNPFFEWLDNRHQGYTLGEALRNAKNKNDRKVEFMDAILHLDDLPTALALAGVQIFVPFIPLFFAVSGYRTGIGYRNQSEKPAFKRTGSLGFQPQMSYSGSGHTGLGQPSAAQIAQFQQLMRTRPQAAASY